MINFNSSINNVSPSFGAKVPELKMPEGIKRVLKPSGITEYRLPDGTLYGDRLTSFSGDVFFDRIYYPGSGNVKEYIDYHTDGRVSSKQVFYDIANTLQEWWEYAKNGFMTYHGTYNADNSIKRAEHYSADNGVLKSVVENGYVKRYDTTGRVVSEVKQH